MVNSFAELSAHFRFHWKAHLCPFQPRTRRKLLKQSMDLRDPEQAYPLARSMRRTVHAHLGPTNSGKTHSALQALRTARSGVYCGPLRLLAWEVHDRLSNAGLLCNLRTGQEIREPEGGAWHTSCTIEMAGINRPIDVAVVDEIQMLTHPERGWAWSRALLGLPSDIVHVCGSADALPLLEQLVEACEDELIVHTYERLSPLSVSRHSLDGDLSRIQPGDCLVAFSRREIFSLKQRVEEASGLECCMVYGSLPPETRSAQAKDFNDPGTSSQVLVASDAIGMGLNLNIQRIVFSSLHKFDGMQVRPLQPTEVMQIAGRAGRYGTAYAAGEVTCLHQSDLPMLRRAMDTTLQPLKKSGLAPTFEQLDLFDRASGQRLYFSQLLTAFEDSARLSSRHFCCDLESTIRLAEIIDDVKGLSLSERHTLCQAPIDARDSLHASCFSAWVKQYAGGKVVTIRHAPPSRPPKTHAELQALESYFRVLDGYLWLGLRGSRFEQAFSLTDKVNTYREEVSVDSLSTLDTSAQIIEAALDALPPIESREKRESANAARRRIQQMANKQRYSTTRKR